MRLLDLEINSFKSFSKKTTLEFEHPVVCIVGPNGSGKSNVVEAIRFALGEQSMKSMRGKAGLDLIFKGSKNLPKGTRASVKISFDNSDKIFKLSNETGENINLDYDTISIFREVYPDGLNKYVLNGSEVRLKDINALLASVNIGSSGHHIISQGEADRILNANPKDRREMVEDALGLKIYQYKIKESERKLEKTENNMKEVAMLRREVAPHLNFLKKQMEKIEKAKEMKVELLSLYREYLKKESIYLEKEKSVLHAEKIKITHELDEINKKISDTGDGGGEVENKKVEELKSLERKIAEVGRTKGDLERKLGRIEGIIEAKEEKTEEEEEVIIISEKEVKTIINEINSSVDEALARGDIEEVKPILVRIKSILQKFIPVKKSVSNVADLELLKKNHKEILSEIDNINLEEKKIREQIDHLKGEISKELESSRDKEREKFTYKVKQQEFSSSLNMVNIKEDNLKREMEVFENEIKEGSALIGPEILSYKDFEVSGDFDRNTEGEQRRKIERIKIKLEDAGLGNGSEIEKEFEEASDRDKFLEKELTDLNTSIELLRNLIKDLQEKIDIEFQVGVKKINKEFQEFFSLMFGGGTGHLSIVAPVKKKKEAEEDEEQDVEEIEEEEGVSKYGIEIDVSLPHKKVKELHALSGGERSLTSIALLFAMSQVNPPPFLVLDETDAALDEANSRKYGDMIEKLSKRSQLIVVTHNRETMSRAGVLYGVTLGSDGASKLLSVKFEEAQAIAK